MEDLVKFLGKEIEDLKNEIGHYKKKGNLLYKYSFRWTYLYKYYINELKFRSTLKIIINQTIS